MELLKVYWFGYGGSSHLAEDLRPVIQGLDMSLTTVHEWDNADVKWTLDSWKSEVAKADIVILPIAWTTYPAKSQNRLTQALSLGKPVVCSPLDAYKAVEEKYPGCCLFADTPEEWKTQLSRLRHDPILRDKLKEQGLKAAQDYSIDKIGQKWVQALTDRDTVDIVIPVYMGTCLKFCLESIRACTSLKYQLIVINNGPNEDTHRYLEQQKGITYIRKSPMTFAQAVNAGIKAGKSKYVCILNDDVIVSRGWLNELVQTCRMDPMMGAVGPLSNCDKGWLHNYDIEIGGVKLVPGQNTPEQIIPIIPEIYSFRTPVKEIPDRDWVAYYCTLIPRAVIDKVGLLNEEYINSGEDVDHCRRIKLMGYKIAQNYRSFCFHFGAVSRRGLEQIDYEKFHEEDRKTQATLARTWGRKTVLLYSGPSWERWDFNSVDNGGIGGSETWQVFLSRELSTLGYRVIMMCDCPNPHIYDKDVEYMHYSEYPKFIEQHWVDYFISSRTTDTLKFPIRAGKIFVMIHDLWLLSGRDQLFSEKVTKYCVLSKWHWDFVKSYHGLPDEKLALTTNGIDFDKFSDKGIERNPYRLHWSSSPDRGLDTLLYLFDFIKAEVPELELHVFYGFENWEQSARSHNNQNDIKKISDLKKSMGKEGIIYHGRIGQKDLVKEELKASLWAYPTDFEETFCCHPTTRIMTTSGSMAISDIKTNDYVFTHTANRCRVINVFKRDVKDALISIQTTGLKDDLLLTQNHKILALKRKSIICNKRASITVKHPSVCTKRGEQCGYQDDRYFVKGLCEKIFNPYKPDWIPAMDLERGDYVLYPRNQVRLQPGVLSDYLDDKDKYLFRNKFIFRKDLKKTPLYMKSKILDFKMTTSFLEVCGWYVAEGCSKRNIRFVLSKHEMRDILFIKKVFNKIGKYVSISDNITDNSKIVTISSLTLSEFFSFNFGSHAKIKKIPQWVKDLDPALLQYFLRGLLAGDGCISRGRFTYAGSSQQLALDLFDIFIKMGIIPSMRNYFNSGIINIRENGTHVLKQDPSRKLPMVRIDTILNQHLSFARFCGCDLEKRPEKGRYLLDKDYAYFQIQKINKIEYEGSVYNLEVDTDNSYIANDIIVHNCITAVECQQAGVPVIASNYAGLKTTVGDSGILIGSGNKGESYTKEYREEFVRSCVELLKDKEKWKDWSVKGRQNAMKYSWTNCALRWKELFESSTNHG